MSGPRAFRRLRVLDAQITEPARPDGFVSQAVWVLTFDGPAPSLEQLRALAVERLAGMPALGQLLVPAPLRVTRPLWRADVPWRVEDHVGELPAQDDLAGVLRLAGEAVARRLPHDLPLWRLWLVPYTDGEHCALVLAYHHALADGNSAFEIMSRLIEARDEDPTPVASRGRRRPREALLEEVRGLAGGAASIARAIAGLRSPEARAELRENAGAVLSVVGELRYPAPALERLNGPQSAERAAIMYLVEHERLRRLCEAFDCSRNVVYLAQLTGALRRLLEQTGGLPPAPLQASVPVNIATPVERAWLGNHIAPVRIALPVDEPSLARRFEIVREETRGIRDSRAVRGLRTLTRLRALLPLPLLRFAFRVSSGPRTVNLVASNLNGLRGQLSLLGRPATAIGGWTFNAPEHALSSVLVATTPRVTVNVLADPVRFPQAAALPDLLERELEELEAFAERSAQPARSPGGAGSVRSSVGQRGVSDARRGT